MAGLLIVVFSPGLFNQHLPRPLSFVLIVNGSTVTTATTFPHRDRRTSTDERSGPRKPVNPDSWSMIPIALSLAQMR